MAESFEILDPEEYTGAAQAEGFSFGILVMNTFKKAVENGSKEMREGYWNTKFDRMGNAHRVWIPDSRQEFIEAVASMRMLLERCLDDASKEELASIDEEIKQKYEHFCKLDKNDWLNAPEGLRNKWRMDGSFFREGMLTQSLPYAYEYISEKVKLSRKLVTLFGKLVERHNDFGEVSYAV